MHEEGFLSGDHALLNSYYPILHVALVRPVVLDD